MSAEPLCCSFCKRTDGGPFAAVTNMAPEGAPEPLICKRCCDERGIEVEWGPTFTATTTF